MLQIFYFILFFYLKGTVHIYGQFNVNMPDYLYFSTCLRENNFIENPEVKNCYSNQNGVQIARLLLDYQRLALLLSTVVNVFIYYLVGIGIFINYL